VRGLLDFDYEGEDEDEETSVIELGWESLA